MIAELSGVARVYPVPGGKEYFHAHLSKTTKFEVKIVAKVEYFL